MLVQWIAVPNFQLQIDYTGEHIFFHFLLHDFY